MERVLVFLPPPWRSVALFLSIRGSPGPGQVPGTVTGGNQIVPLIFMEDNLGGNRLILQLEGVSSRGCWWEPRKEPQGTEGAAGTP